MTDDGILYVVEFSDASAYFDSVSAIAHSFEDVSFTPVGNKGGRDEQIAPTIAEIIKQRCKTHNTAIVYVCDQSGDKPRSKLFKVWNGMFNNGEFHFQPVIIEHPKGKLYTGIIVEARNANAQLYLSDFTAAMKDIESKFN